MNKNKKFEKYCYDPLFKPGDVSVVRLHNRRVVVNVFENNEGVILKFINYDKDTKDFINDGLTAKAFARRGIVCTYVKLSYEAYMALVQIGVELTYWNPPAGLTRGELNGSDKDKI